MGTRCCHKLARLQVRHQLQAALKNLDNLEEAMALKAEWEQNCSVPHGLTEHQQLALVNGRNLDRSLECFFFHVMW